MQNMQECIRPFAQLLRVSARKRRNRLPEQIVRNLLEHTVTHAFGIGGPQFWGLTRGHPHVALARQVGMYLAHVTFELSLTEVGNLFARDRTTVAHACSVVEDRRDDPTFDRALDLIETAIRHLKPQGFREPGAAAITRATLAPVMA